MKLIRLPAAKKPIPRQKPPKHLSLEARRLWVSLVSEWSFNGAELEILRTALESRDRYQQARRQIDKEGLTVVSETGVVHKHPAVEVEKIARSGFLQAFKMLGLREDELPARLGRPPGSSQI
jgi:P27 family predicted phage terminase small subunit